LRHIHVEATKDTKSDLEHGNQKQRQMSILEKLHMVLIKKGIKKNA